MGSTAVQRSDKKWSKGTQKGAIAWVPILDPGFGGGRGGEMKVRARASPPRFPPVSLMELRTPPALLEGRTILRKILLK